MRMDSSIWERIIIGTSKGCMKNACVRKEIEGCVHERGWGCKWTLLRVSKLLHTNMPAGWGLRSGRGSLVLVST